MANRLLLHALRHGLGTLRTPAACGRHDARHLGQRRALLGMAVTAAGAQLAMTVPGQRQHALTAVFQYSPIVFAAGSDSPSSTNPSVS